MDENNSSCGSSPAVSTVPASIPDAAPIWRNGVGAAVEAVDRVRAHFNKTIPARRKSPAFRELDDFLDEVLQMLVNETRKPMAIVSYSQANNQCRRIQGIVAQAIDARRAETGTGSVHESAVRQDAPLSSGTPTEEQQS